MLLLTPENHSRILGAIERIHEACINTPGALLTEVDLQCLLFRELSAIPVFSTPVESRDSNILATPIHTEVSWYDQNGKLTIKPDITILDPQKLSLLYEIGSLKAPPSKEFHFDGKAFIFELKFVRGPKGIQKTELASIQKDFDKITQLFQRLDNNGEADNVFCFFVVFSRYGAVSDAWNEFYASHLNEEHWEFIYRSLGVPRPIYGRERFV